jgi:hypothetical protein
MKLTAPLYPIPVLLATYSTALPHTPSLRDLRHSERMLRYQNSGGIQTAATAGPSSVEQRGYTAYG